MSGEKDLEFWLDFVSKNEEQETNDKLGIYYTGYSFSYDQAEEFYKQNYDFFKRIVSVYYLNNMFYTDNFTFSKSYEDYKTGTKLNFSNNNRKPIFSVWRNVSKDMYDYEFTIFANNYLNNSEISELYDSVLKRIAVPISSVKYGFEDLIKLAIVDDILINKDFKVKKLD